MADMNVYAILLSITYLIFSIFLHILAWIALIYMYFVRKQRIEVLKKLEHLNEILIKRIVSKKLFEKTANKYRWDMAMNPVAAEGKEVEEDEGHYENLDQLKMIMEKFPEEMESIYEEMENEVLRNDVKPFLKLPEIRMPEKFATKVKCLDPQYATLKEFKIVHPSSSFSAASVGRPKDNIPQPATSPFQIKPEKKKKEIKKKLAAENKKGFMAHIPILGQIPIINQIGAGSGESVNEQQTQMIDIDKPKKDSKKEKKVATTTSAQQPPAPSVNEPSVSDSLRTERLFESPQRDTAEDGMKEAKPATSDLQNIFPRHSPNEEDSLATRKIFLADHEDDTEEEDD